MKKTKIYIVTAHYSDWEWSSDVLIGVFDDEALASQAKDDWEKARTLFLESEPPFDEDDWDILTNEQRSIQMKWDSNRSAETDFHFTKIEEHTLNEYIPWK